MWPTHLTLGLRALLRDPLFTVINLVGLAIGIAGCLMIVLFIRFETSFDDWLPDAERTFQFQRVSTSGQNIGRRLGMTPFVASTAMPGQFPEIESATGVVYGDSVFRQGGEIRQLDSVYATDGNFLDVLRLPLVSGDPATALSSVDNIILTESAARRLFGRTDVVGRTLTRIGPEGDSESRVTGILRDIPGNSHLRIEAVYRANSASGAADATYTRWNTIGGWVYARLRPGADVAAMNRRMAAALQRVVPTVDQDPSASDRLGFTEELVDVRSINTAAIDSGTMRRGTPSKTLVTFGIVAAFLLLVACVNFTNLATARASRRAREVGLRKTLGATRRQLIVQFLLESSVMVAAAGLLALTIAELTLPFLNDLVGSSIRIRYFAADGIVLPLILLLAIVAVVGGVYPAFFLSRYRPAAVLKANQGGGPETPGTGRLRTALVLLQFAVSIALIICTAIIYAQTVFARSADPGYKASGLLFVGGPDDIGDRTQIETFMRRIGAIPGVTSVARTGVTPNPNTTSISTFRPPAAPASVSLHMIAVDGGTFRTLGMRLLAGRTVTEAREADIGYTIIRDDPERKALVEQRGLNVVLSADALPLFGFASPQQALGRQINPDTDDGHAVAPYTVVGVVNEARFDSARFESVPKLYYVAPSGYLALAVRFDDANGATVRTAIERLWKASVDRAPFDGFFADRRIADMYRADERRGRLFAIFAGFAVLISCLGLFGLAAFTAQRRTKEIGIRKVLGARTRDIIRLLVWQFTRPVLAANLIAWPVAWWAMRNWLDEFHDRIDLGPTPFAIAGALALVIAIGTVVGHALKVARANPIHALRYE